MKKQPSNSMATLAIAKPPDTKYAPRFRPTQDNEESDVLPRGDVVPIMPLVKPFCNVPEHGGTQPAVGALVIQ